MWMLSVFFFNDTATTEIYTLSLHDALPILFDRRALHPQANPEERHLAFPRVLNGVHHSLNSALAKSAWHENSVVAMQSRRRGLRRINLFRFNPFKYGLVIVRQSTVQQRFAQALVRIFELHVFADDRDSHFARRMMQPVHQV